MLAIGQVIGRRGHAYPYLPQCHRLRLLTKPPTLVRMSGREPEDDRDTVYHYIAHTSLGVSEEPSQSSSTCEPDGDNRPISLTSLQTPRTPRRILTISPSDTVVKDVIIPSVRWL